MFPDKYPLENLNFVGCGQPHQSPVKSLCGQGEDKKLQSNILPGFYFAL